MAEQLRVMISSTALDLPEHRKEVMDACLRQGMFPIMMEHLPASDAEAIPASLKMVDEADIYLLILAHRYGYVPTASNPTRISVTEHEYNRAVERKIPCLSFVMHADHPVKAADVEKGEGAVKLEAFKNRVLVKVANFFTSPADLRAHVINALSHHREAELTTFHYVGDIAEPPEAYIAHPYTLLQTHTLIGRKAELKLLTDWITGKELEADGRKFEGDSIRIMSVVAIGGMGKSALTWKWFNDIAPEEMKPLTGRMWWSFYESDATFENFVTRALAYVTERTLDQVQGISAPERETQLLAALDREPFLLVLDGLERILIAYARMDASRLDDNEVGKDKGLRKTSDPRVGGFLRKLTQVRNTRILVSSRLYPAELETPGEDPIPHSFRCDIKGLTDEDAVELWRALGVSGARDVLLPVFNTFGKHPLLIQALAGEVKRFRPAPGDFTKWRRANPDFDPSKFSDLRDAMVHVLEFAFHGLNEEKQKVLHTIAAFRMPTGYDTLTNVLVGENKPCASESELDPILNELEDRGLVGWDKRANRYDLHPIVRGVVWSRLATKTQHAVYSSLHTHFAELPMIGDWRRVTGLEDLTPAIELYNSLIGMGRYDDAAVIFRDRLSEPTLYRVSAGRQRLELLEMLFPDGLGHLPRLRTLGAQAYTLNALAQSYSLSGHPGRAVMFHRRQNVLRENAKDPVNLSTGLYNLSHNLQSVGELFKAEIAANRALITIREGHNRQYESTGLYWLGLVLAARGDILKSKIALDRSLVISHGGKAYVAYDYQAMRALWIEDFESAKQWADKAFEYCNAIQYQRGGIRSRRLQGAAALGLDHLATADQHFHLALNQARVCNDVEDELPALVAMGDLRRRQKDLESARELLNDVWEYVERGPYPLIHADAFNVLAQIECDESNVDAAIEAATKAYRLAWCDGPPFAYHWGLEKAKTHLKELGAPEPEMPPFDESKFEAMPEVEIDPEDEFHVGNTPEKPLT
jgi:tetratricopeptide (TPR) repeat protein